MAPILSYCTNVHPAEGLGELLALVEGPLARVRSAWRGDAPMGAGLWLTAATARVLAQDPAACDRLRAALEAAGLFAFSVNAFPAGSFHAPRVKEAVYRPTWAEPERLRYTLDAATALARLLPPGAEGSLSTVPVGYSGFGMGEDALEAAAANLRRAAEELERLSVESGRSLRLGLEPEPLAVLETVAEAVRFLRDRVYRGLGRGEAVARARVGLCVDACHLACVFEDLEAALARAAAAGVPVVKGQLSSALELPRPAENPAGCARLRAFAEPRYLHQCCALVGDPPRRIAANDLDDLFAGEALHPAFETAARVRSHVHVPLCWEGDDSLRPTRGERDAELLARATPHLEVETYTWGVLPSTVRSASGGRLEEAIVAELRWAEERLRRVGRAPG